MRIDVTQKAELAVAAWCVTDAISAMDAIEQQLNAAIAVWPVLKGYELVRVKPK